MKNQLFYGLLPFAFLLMKKLHTIFRKLIATNKRLTSGEFDRPLEDSSPRLSGRDTHDARRLTTAGLITCAGIYVDLRLTVVGIF